MSLLTDGATSAWAVSPPSLETSVCDCVRDCAVAGAFAAYAILSTIMQHVNLYYGIYAPRRGSATKPTLLPMCPWLIIKAAQSWTRRQKIGDSR
jgi:hypothetical protein